MPSQQEASFVRSDRLQRRRQTHGNPNKNKKHQLNVSLFHCKRAKCNNAGADADAEENADVDAKS